MIARFDPDQLLRIGEGLDKGFEFSGWAKLIARSADEEFWLGAGAQEIKIIDPVFNGHGGQTERDEEADPVVGTGSP